jgi:hypothetical protein
VSQTHVRVRSFGLDSLAVLYKDMHSGALYDTILAGGSFRADNLCYLIVLS